VELCLHCTSTCLPVCGGPVVQAIMDFIVMQLQLASVSPPSRWARGRTTSCARSSRGRQDGATGRGFVVKHIKFAYNYRLYSRSHFTLGVSPASTQGATSPWGMC